MAKRKGPSPTEELEAKRRQMENDRRRMAGEPPLEPPMEDDSDLPAFVRAARRGRIVEKGK